MPYSVFVGVALTIHVLISADMFIKKDNIPAIKTYRWFLIAIGMFYVSDLLWGIFEARGLSVALYVDTTIYFIFMGLTIFAWTSFVVNYLQTNKYFSILFKVVGILFFAAEIILLIINIFTPLLFRVDFETTKYQAYGARYVMLWAQIGMYVLITLYSIVYTFKTKTKNYRRYIAISLFSIVAATCIGIQLSDPEVPFYSIGCLIGVCILDTFALSDTKEVIKTRLQRTIEINKQNEAELNKAMQLAYTDPLTGVKSKHAYVELEDEIDKKIAKNQMNEFAVAVFDLNGLKKINDTYGHEAGDDYIVKAVDIISEYFPFDSIYRFGGDEFVVMIEGDIFKDRTKLYNAFLKRIDDAIEDEPVISSGVSRFRPETDNTFRAVFYRADKMMYSRKELLKERRD